MSKEQISLINWMYNLLITEMSLKPEVFYESDREKLKALIEKRFPAECDLILKPFDM